MFGRSKLFGVAIAAIAGIGLTAVSGSPAGAATATAVLSGGSLQLGTTTGGDFGTTALTGANQTLPGTSTVAVSDATGSGTGWNISAVGTQFTTGTHALGASGTSTTATSASVGCDSGVTCTTATSTVTISAQSPYSLPTGTATKIFNASTDTGMGNQTVTFNWSLNVPGNAYAGTYHSTWTFTLGSAP